MFPDTLKSYQDCLNQFDPSSSILLPSEGRRKPEPSSRRRGTRLGDGIFAVRKLTPFWAGDIVSKLIAIVCILVLAPLKTHAKDASKTADGFALPQSGHAFSFPRDHGSHDDFKIEWWYITGHLFDDDGRRFGFQATFFRSAGSPTNFIGTNNFSFGSDKLFLAHMALLDVKSGKFIHQQRLNRDGWDAFSATNELNVRNGNWSLRRTEDRKSVV